MEAQSKGNKNMAAVQSQWRIHWNKHDSRGCLGNEDFYFAYIIYKKCNKLITIVFYLQGARIHAWIPPQNVHHMQNHIIEGQTYAVHNFIVRQYAAMQRKRCFANDIFVQFNNLTEVLFDGGVDFIHSHVFHFTNLSNVMAAATQDEFLIGESFLLRIKDLYSVYRYM